MTSRSPRTVTILYGTETYTAEGLAERTADALNDAGFQAKAIDMEAFDPDNLSTLRTLLIVTSTYGNGDPPANAEPMFDAIMADTAPRLDGLRFSVCGLGDRTYPRFAQCGKDFDRRLAELGGQRISPRVDCDVDPEPAWEGWLEAVQEALATLPWTEEAAATAPPAPEPAPVVAVADVPVTSADPLQAANALHLSTGPQADPSAEYGSRRNPVAATVRVNRSLTGAGASRDVRYLEVDLGEGAPAWSAGDSFGFFQPNAPELVDEILAACKIAGDTTVVVRDEQMSVRTALLTRLDVQTASDPAWASEHTGQGAAPADGPPLHVRDYVLARGVPLEAQALVDRLRRISPRLYSVASSPTVHNNVVSFVASVVRYEAYGRERWGTCTGWMANHLPEGAKVRTYVQRLDTFRLAADDTDIIMIGPGTGVAPFRAFLQERERRRARGRSWLFFGSRNRETDFLFGDELQAWRTRGTLTRLDLAFSRDGAEKRYVQHCMMDNAKALWQWLSHGAVVYVCGDASAMAPDVHKALQAIAHQEGGLSESDARTFVRELAQTGRYMRDVY